MYKGASQNLQHATRVDLVHPTRGFIDGPGDATDTLPDVSHLTVDQCRTEQAQLRIENVRLEQDLAVAKTLRRKREAKAIGQRKATIILRLSAVNNRIRSIDGDSELYRLRTAVRELLDDETANRIFDRARDLRKEPKS